jgi:hypothetical protein
VSILVCFFQNERGNGNASGYDFEKSTPGLLPANDSTPTTTLVFTDSIPDKSLVKLRGSGQHSISLSPQPAFGVSPASARLTPSALSKPRSKSGKDRSSVSKEHSQTRRDKARKRREKRVGVAEQKRRRDGEMGERRIQAAVKEEKKMKFELARKKVRNAVREGPSLRRHQMHRRQDEQSGKSALVVGELFFQIRSGQWARWDPVGSGRPCKTHSYDVKNPGTISRGAGTTSRCS